MEITPLELGLAAAAVVVAFGPKKLPKKKSTVVVPPEKADLRALRASQYAAGRAPSPLSVRGAGPIYTPEDYIPGELEYQYTTPSKLPYESFKPLAHGLRDKIVAKPLPNPKSFSTLMGMVPEIARHDQGAIKTIVFGG